jgi:hypothetical protein
VKKKARNSSQFPSAPINLEQVVQIFRNAGCDQLWVKRLAKNDDSKRQIYLSKKSLQAFNILPPVSISLAPALRKGTSPTKKRIKPGMQRLFGNLDFKWLFTEHPPEAAQHAKLICYPQYSEVRFSGFSRGTRSLPKIYLCEKAGETYRNRLLFLGTAPNRQTYGFLTVGHADLREQIQHTNVDKPNRPLIPISISKPSLSGRQRLLATLREIHRRGWIRGCRLTAQGLMYTNAPNAVGYTLEAQLGIASNGKNLPDFEGYEIKATAAGKDGEPHEKPITLMTPEPDRGVYKTCGVLEFLKRWGYPDAKAPLHRRNFGGIYRFGQPHPVTGLKLKISGFDSETPNRIAPDGMVMLVDHDGTIAAGWSFSKLLAVWSRKHARAAYVSAEKRGTPREFRYAAKVTLCEGTDFLKVLRLLASGDLYLDPGIKAENWHTNKPKFKKRNQFRTKSSQLQNLYEHTEQRSLR